MTYYQELRLFEEFVQNKFEEIFSKIHPLHTRAAINAEKEASLIITKYINKIRERIIIYENKTEEYFRLINQNGETEDSKNLFNIFLKGFADNIEFLRKAFELECLALATLAKSIEDNSLSIKN